MTGLAWNLVLALVWCALTGRLTAVDFAIGFAVGFGILAWLTPGQSARGYVRRAPRVPVFVVVYAWDVVQSSLRVAWDVVTPAARRRPAILAVPLELETDAEITLLANLITFTPGTLALDVTEDRRVMLVHDMFVSTPEAAKRRIKRHYERWLLRIMR